MSLTNKQMQTGGYLIIAVVIGLAVSGLALSAVSDRHKVTVHAGYTIYTADDDTLEPNPLDLQGEYYYVKGYWDKPKATLNDVYHYAEVLKGDEAPSTKPDNPEEDPIIKTTKVHFTVQKKITTHESETHRTKEHEYLPDINVIIYRSGEKQFAFHAETNADGIAVFTVPVGTYDYKVITDGYEKNSNNVQEWTMEGEIYYKKITLIYVELDADGNVVDVTPPAVADDPNDDVITVAETLDDDEGQATWKAPWVEGGGNAQLDQTYDEQFNQEISRGLIALAILGTMGLVMLFVSGANFGRKFT